MDDIMGVRVRQRTRYLAENSHCFCERQFAVEREPRAERFAFHKWHGEVRLSAYFARGEQRNDVRMLQAGGNGYLPAEAVDCLCARHLVRQNLYHNLPAKRVLSRDEDT